MFPLFPSQVEAPVEMSSFSVVLPCAFEGGVRGEDRVGRLGKHSTMVLEMETKEHLGEGHFGSEDEFGEKKS